MRFICAVHRGVGGVQAYKPDVIGHVRDAFHMAGDVYALRAGLGALSAGHAIVGAAGFGQRVIGGLECAGVFVVGELRVEGGREAQRGSTFVVYREHAGDIHARRTVHASMW